MKESPCLNICSTNTYNIHSCCADYINKRLKVESSKYNKLSHYQILESLYIVQRRQTSTVTRVRLSPPHSNHLGISISFIRAFSEDITFGQAPLPFGRRTPVGGGMKQNHHLKENTSMEGLKRLYVLQ